jgi:hypothetical protein
METFHPQISQIRADLFLKFSLWKICEGRNGCEATAGLSIRVLKICGPMRIVLPAIHDRSRRRPATADSSYGELAQFESATGRTRCGELVGHSLKARSERFNLLLLLRRGSLRRAHLAHPEVS